MEFPNAAPLRLPGVPVRGMSLRVLACGSRDSPKCRNWGTASGMSARRACAALSASICAVFLVVVLSGPARPQAAERKDIPALASSEFAWQAQGVHWLDPPRGLGRGPIRQDPLHPFHGNADGPGQVTPEIGNVRDPVLKPWAAAQMTASNEEVLSGKRGLAFAAQSTCHPGGVPGQLLFPAEPFYFIQTPKEVWMIWQRDHMVRRVYLTDRHSEVVKPSWFGESIGRYENGELVIDTIGLSTRNSYIDYYRTPHSEKEHVVERYRLLGDGRMLEALVMVEDPDTFNEPLYMVQRWRKVRNPLLETVCAENNGDHFKKNLFPIPQADKPYF
jgi:hypothetical protein